jgi:hypothetical protein
MSAHHTQHDLERHVRERTGGRIRDRAVELCPERVILRGRTGSYHVKQLAQHGVWDLLPQTPLDNAIVVETVT